MPQPRFFRQTARNGGYKAYGRLIRLRQLLAGWAGCYFFRALNIIDPNGIGATMRPSAQPDAGEHLLLWWERPVVL